MDDVPAVGGKNAALGERPPVRAFAQRSSFKLVRQWGLARRLS